MWWYNPNPNIWEAESGGSRVQGQPGLYSQIVSPKTKTTPSKVIAVVDQALTIDNVLSTLSVSLSPHTLSWCLFA
jgi:hypothetical protein